MIRPEQAADLQLIHAVHAAAFPSEDEANLVDSLRVNRNLIASFVALEESEIFGHIAFSPVTLDGVSITGAGLTPVAVLPSYQRRGYGSQLIEAGLEACRQAAIDFVVVLGEPDYYHRFNFRTAADCGLQNEYGVRDEFMVLELTDQCLGNLRGLVRYGPEFRALV